jgi:hypothetical protein
MSWTVRMTLHGRRGAFGFDLALGFGFGFNFGLGLGRALGLAILRVGFLAGLDFLTVLVFLAGLAFFGVRVFCAFPDFLGLAARAFFGLDFLDIKTPLQPVAS